jgi:hypothetical protein
MFICACYDRYCYYKWFCSLLLGLGRFLSFFLISYTVSRSIGRRMSPPQGPYVQKGQREQNKRSHRHPCLEWGLNQRPQHSSGIRLLATVLASTEDNVELQSATADSLQ